jgi:hypothetical protein
LSSKGIAISEPIVSNGTGVDDIGYGTEEGFGFLAGLRSKFSLDFVDISRFHEISKIKGRLVCEM